MNDLHLHTKRVFRSALFFMAACFLAWALVPDYKAYAAGLVLGTIISLINARLLQYKIEKLTALAMANEGKRANSGYISRVSMVLIGTMIALKLEQFDLIATIAGFFYAQVATLLMGFLFIIQHKK